MSDDGHVRHQKNLLNNELHTLMGGVLIITHDRGLMT